MADNVMYLQKKIRESGKTLREIADKSHVPYDTLHDLCIGKTDIRKARSETVYKLAHALSMPADDLLEPYMTYKEDFYLFRSRTCHTLKRLGDMEFVLDILQSNIIPKYYDWEWYAECLYTLSMIDYISRVNDIPLAKEYDKYRRRKMKNVLYPSDIYILDKCEPEKEWKKWAWEKGIPEFKVHNIVEYDVRDVV